MFKEPAEAGEKKMGEESSHEDRAPAVEKVEGWDRTFAQMWELCFQPEIERRVADGSLPANFRLYMAQALFPPREKN